MKIQRLLLGSALFASLGLGLAFVRPSAVDSHNKEAKGAAPAAYAIDPVHSSVLFKIKHMGSSWFFGRFNSIKGTLTYAADAPEACKVEIEVPIDSVDTNDEKRNTHLKSADFFDAAQFKTATFKSKKVEKSANGMKVTGDLSMHGVTKELSFNIEVTGSGKGMKGEELVGFYGTLELKRGDFGIKTYPGALGEEVTLMVSLETSKG